MHSPLKKILGTTNLIQKNFLKEKIFATQTFGPESGSYLGYTGRDANVVARAALDP
jgi:hypothetical protein